MASIRRTLSPYHNGNNNNSPFSVQSPTHKQQHSRFQSPLSRFGVKVSRFISGEKYPKKINPHTSWRIPFYRCLLFFMLGLLYGLFAPVNDLENRDRREQFDEKHEFLDVQESLKEKIVFEKVELAVDRGGLVVKERFDFVPRKQLIVVTPTYNRALQAYYLNRVGQVLRLVHPPVIWIVVEINAASMETAAMLRDMGVMYRHLVCTKNFTDVKDRGVQQRNTALEHIEQHKLDGIVYFADDDNVYSLELFESMREISRFGTWPVAMLAQSKNKAVLEGPVCNGSQVIGWHTNEKSKQLRRFHVDMSGFAFNSTIFWDPKRWKRPTSQPVRQLDNVKEGFQETTFIEQVVEDESQMEGTPTGCSKVMNWHLHLEAHELGYPKGWLLQKNLDIVLPIV